jgi:hypothetical protein
MSQSIYFRKQILANIAITLKHLHFATFQVIISVLKH